MPLSEEKSHIHRSTHHNALATVTEVHTSMTTLDKNKISENEQGQQDPNLKSTVGRKDNSSVSGARLSSGKRRADILKNLLK